MADESTVSPISDDSLPIVRLGLRAGSSRPVVHEMAEASFLVGTVPGCDLRLPGAALPPVLCLVMRGTDGVKLRKLAPTQSLVLNGQPASQAMLGDGDRIALAGMEIHVAIAMPAGESSGKVRSGARSPQSPSEAPAAAQVEGARKQLQKQVEEFREQVARFHAEQQALEAEDRERQHELEERSAQVDTARQELEEQRRAMEADRAAWLRRREDIEQEGRKLHERERGSAAGTLELERREKALQKSREEVEEQRLALEKRMDEAERQKQETAALRQELTQIRKELYDRYRERRDRIAGLQEAVARAARKAQERKQLVDAETARAAALAKEQEARQADLEMHAAELEKKRQQIDEERRQLDTRRDDLHEELADRLADIQAHEAKIVEDRQALEKSQAQHKADLVRLDRLQATLDQRQKQVQERALEIDKRFEQLQGDSKDIEDQALQLDRWQTQLTEEAEKQVQQKAEHEAAAAQVAQRAAAFEGQQAMLAALRTRLERLREDLRRQEQQLTQQRVQQEATEVDLQQKVLEAQRLRADLDGELQMREQDRTQLLERTALLDAAVAQLRQAQEALTRQDEDLRRRGQALDEAVARQTEEGGLIQARARQNDELKQRLEADRQALRERSETLEQAEKVREGLQEQLRKRSEELAARQKAVGENARQVETATAALAARGEEIENERRQTEARMETLRKEMEAQTAQLEQARADLNRREETLRRHVERLKEGGRNVGMERKALGEEKAEWEASRAEQVAALVQAQHDLASAQREALDLQQTLPDMELRARRAAEKLEQARELLRGHLAEIHGYAKQSRDDLEAMQALVQAEAERVRKQELSLNRARDEHRLAVAAFRQQLLEWQGQISEMKQDLAHGETRLERRQAQVAEQAKQVESTTERLARQAEQLEEQERLVSERRVEMGRHLEDMRQWYRNKLRELSGVDDAPPAPAILKESTGSEKRSSTAPQRATGDNEPAAEDTLDDSQPLIPEATSSILALTGDVSPGDRQLGDLLQSLGLIDADALRALLVEARRQRRSLRQVLLAGGSVTLYQLALIEAGNIDGLVLGPVRVVDRVRATAREIVYRVFDPRAEADAGGSALLRHLAEAEAEDAVRPDEFRQRFTAAAALRHPQILATREVLEIAGRPAVLQEMRAGLPSSDWPALAGVPGVWFRLLTQTASGLHAAHRAGLAHGHLHPSLVLLDGEGAVKLCGFGEPPWLVEPPVTFDLDADAASDVYALGQVAADWAAGGQRKSAKSKPLPEPLKTILDRMTAEKPEERYPSAQELLEDLERASAAVSSNTEAWDRLLRHVRDHSTSDGTIRQSA